jgi:hypothetical protein
MSTVWVALRNYGILVPLSDTNKPNEAGKNRKRNIHVEITFILLKNDLLLLLITRNMR